MVCASVLPLSVMTVGGEWEETEIEMLSESAVLSGFQTHLKPCLFWRSPAFSLKYAKIQYALQILLMLALHFHDSSTLELLQKCVVPAVLYQTKAPSSEVTSLCQQRGKDIWRNSLWTWAFRGWFLWCMDIHFLYYVYVCICSDSLFHTLILKMKCIFKNFLCYSKLITLLFYLELLNPCVKQNNRIIICYSLVIFPCSLMFRPSCFLRPVSLPMCSSLVSHIWPRKEVLSLTPFFLAFVLSFAQPELWDLAPAVSLP